jgi:hypothetical protein
MTRLFSAVPRRTFTVLLFSGIVLSALFAACDMRHPLAPAPSTGPAVAPPLVRTASLPPPPAPIELGSVFIGVPASTSVADAQAIEHDWRVVGSFEDSTWILVEIDGGVTHAVNPARAALPPFWGCTRFPLAGITAGPSTPFTSGRVDLWENGAGAPLHYRPVDGDPNALSARALSFRELAGSVSARRHVVVAGGIAPLPNQPSHGAYLLSGGQTVRLRAIPPPLGISGPADLAPGESGTYTAAPLFGLQLANPYGAHHLPPGAYGWTFHPGDTAAAPRKRVDVAVPMWHCQNQPTCEYAPPQSGRLAVFAYVEDQLVGAYSGVIRVDSAKVEVACNGHRDSLSLTRGEIIDCRANSPSTSSPVRWAFVADSSPYQNPAPGGTAFAGPVWKGEMILSGKIMASVLNSAQQRSDTFVVRVLPRDWTNKEFPINVQEDTLDAEEFNERPPTIRQLGHIHNDRDFVFNQSMWRPILNGPNALLAYFAEIPLEYRGRVHVNRLALRTGSAFWNAQPVRASGSSPVRLCLRREEDIQGFIPVILKHEGVGLDTLSHAYLWVKEGKKLFGPALEPLTAGSARDLADSAQSILRRLGQKADSASQWADSTGFRPSWCRFNTTYANEE